MSEQNQNPAEVNSLPCSEFSRNLSKCQPLQMLVPEVSALQGSPVRGCAQRGGEPSAPGLSPPPEPYPIQQPSQGAGSPARCSKSPQGIYPGSSQWASALQQVPKPPDSRGLCAQPVPHPCPDPQALSDLRPRGPRGALRVTGKWRAICFYQTRFLSPLSYPAGSCAKAGLSPEPPWPPLHRRESAPFSLLPQLSSL